LEDWSGKTSEKIMAYDLSYLNYNLEVKDETQLIYKRQKLKSHEDYNTKINKLTNHVRELNFTQLWRMILTCKPHVSLIIKGKSNGTNRKEKIYPKCNRSTSWKN